MDGTDPKSITTDQAASKGVSKERKTPRTGQKGSMQVRKRDPVLLGPNGAGKSTTLEHVTAIV